MKKNNKDEKNLKIKAFFHLIIPSSDPELGALHHVDQNA